jgi:hypothetical protein
MPIRRDQLGRFAPSGRRVASVPGKSVARVVAGMRSKPKARKR